jgi:hypothetical protein
MAVRTQPGELARHTVPLRPQHTSCSEAAPRLGGKRVGMQVRGD